MLFIKLSIMAVTVILTGFCLSYLPKPYVYASVLWGIVSILLAVFSAHRWAKAMWVNLAAVVLTLGGTELYFYEVYFNEEPPREMEFSRDETAAGNTDIIDLFGKHDVLGWAPTKSGVFYETTRFEQQLLYKVRYTIDPHGLRVAPPFRGQPGEDRCLLFFGDSFTFGEGVNDDETLPYRVGQKTDGRYRIYNFGFLGYGPHQMLAQLEHGDVQGAIQCWPTHAIYQALPDHVSRAAGLEAWDQFGPRFVLEKDGSVTWRGQFADQQPSGLLGHLRAIHATLPNTLKHYLEKSALYRGLLFLHRPVSETDVALFLQIVDRARALIQSQYPGTSFHVIFWDFSSGEDPLEVDLIKRLQARGMPVHRISEILPNFQGHEAQFEIHPADGHPNKLAYELLADYIMKGIIEPGVSHGVEKPLATGQATQLMKVR